MIAMLAESGVHYTFECLLQSRGSMGDAGQVDGPSLAQLRRIHNGSTTYSHSANLIEYETGLCVGTGNNGRDAGSEMRRSQGSERHSSKLTAHRKAEVPLLCI